jgi:hypothetical protein
VSYRPRPPLEVLHLFDRHKLQPWILVLTRQGLTLEGHFGGLQSGAVCLLTRDGTWFLEESAVCGLRIGQEPAVESLLRDSPGHEPLSKLGLARLIQAETPMGSTIQVDESLLTGQSDFGWLRPWVSELVHTIHDIAADSLGVAALEGIKGFLLTRGPAGMVERREGWLTVAATPEGPQRLKSQILSLL